MSEALFPDGSTYGNGLITGGLAMHRARLITARMALEVWLRQAAEGKPAAQRWQLTRNGHRLAILNVIEPLAGRQIASPTGRCSDKACRDALKVCNELLAAIDDEAIIYTPDQVGPEGTETA
jgi:hypothetical protein